MVILTVSDDRVADGRADGSVELSCPLVVVDTDTFVCRVHSTFYTPDGAVVAGCGLPVHVVVDQPNVSHRLCLELPRTRTGSLAGGSCLTRTYGTSCRCCRLDIVHVVLSDTRTCLK